MMRWFFTAILLLLPSLSHACAVCGTGFEQNRGAFIEATIVMSLLPLALIGGVAFYWRKKSRALAEEEAETHR
jgi:hypothetical protein